MRIALFSDYFPPHAGGGVERVVDELSHGLAHRGHDVRVFTLRTMDAPSCEAAEDGLRVFRAGALSLTRMVGLQSAVSPGLMALALRELRRERPDVIHAHGRFFFSSLVAAAASKLLDVPLVTTLHLGSMDALPLSYRLPVLAYERTLSRAVIGRSARVIAVSRAVADYAGRIGGREERLHVVPNGVDTGRFTPATSLRDDGVLRVAFVGRLVQNKGPHSLLEATPALLRAHPGSEVVFVGDGPMLGRLQRRARELGIAGRVVFQGSRDDVEVQLQRCDIFVRPSLTEGMPLTVLEASACALPVVATPVGGTAEVVRDGVNGLLVPPADVDALARALLRLADDRDLRTRLGTEGRRLVERNHGWPRMVEANIDVYERVRAAALVPVIA